MDSPPENFWVEYGCVPGMTPEETRNEINKLENSYPNLITILRKAEYGG